MPENIIPLKWKRPNSVEYPKVWHRFKARDLNSENLIEYRIEDLVEARAEDAYKHMKENYLRDEPVSQALGGYADIDHFEDYAYGWKSILLQKTPLVCYIEGSDDIIGLSWIFIIHKEDDFFKQFLTNSKSSVTKILFGLVNKLYENFDVHEHYSIDEYMASFTLSVDKRYRGRAIGDHFLATRKLVCKEFGIKLTHTIFSSDFSSRNAENVGFKTDISMSYDELRQLCPQYNLPQVKSAELSLKSLII